jgi:DNA-binding NtrC family response regulator
VALVLVVDDEQRARDLLRHVIAAANHDVIEADSAEAALTAMAQRPADVVFTDVQMPGNDGVWLTLELRKRYPNTAVVLATGVGDLAPTITLRFGVISYLIKPFALDSVRQALTLAVDWHDEAAAKGTEAVEQGRLEEWLNSLQID